MIMMMIMDDDDDGRVVLGDGGYGQGPPHQPHHWQGVSAPTSG